MPKKKTVAELHTPSGRATSITTSLSPAAAAWVRSRPEGASACLRGLVDAALDEAIQTKGYRPLASDLDPNIKIDGDV